MGCPRSPLPASAGCVHSSPPPSPTSSPARCPPSRPSSSRCDLDVRCPRPHPQAPGSLASSAPPLRSVPAAPPAQGKSSPGRERPESPRKRAVPTPGPARIPPPAPLTVLPRRHSQRSHPAVLGVHWAPPQLLLAPRGLGALPGLGRTLQESRRAPHTGSGQRGENLDPDE